MNVDVVGPNFKASSLSSAKLSIFQLEHKRRDINWSPSAISIIKART